MNRYTLLIGILLCFGTSQAVRAQQNFSDTLSYEIVHRNIVIKVKVNGEEARFIYDSGGIPWIIASEAERLGISTSGYQSAVDMNQMASWQQKGVIERMEISPNWTKNKLETVISGDIMMFKDAGLAGLLNNEVFSNVVVSILPREKKIVLTPYRPKGVDRADGIPVKVHTNKGFVIPVQIGGKTISAMFDTGFDRFIAIINEELKREDTTGFEIVNNFFGITAIGIHGLPEPDAYYKLRVPSLTIGDHVFIEGTSVTHGPGQNLIGAELLNYGNVILDIPRHVFYFYPFEDGEIHLGGVISTWDITILPTTDRFEIGGVWGDNQHIEFGDIVTHIDGKSLKDFPKDQYEIERLMEDIQGDTSTVTLLKNGKEQIVPIRRVY